MQRKKLYSVAWNILMEHKSLLLIPILGFISFALLFLALSYPLYSLTQHFFPTLFAQLNQQELLSPWEIVFTGLSLFLIYLLFIFAVVFCNALLIIYIQAIIAGQNTSLWLVFCKALGCTKVLIRWSFFWGSIGVLFSILEYCSDWIGELFVSFFGYMFFSISWILVPIIIEENIGPKQAMHRATELIGKAAVSDNIYIKAIDWRLIGIQALVFLGFLLSFSYDLTYFYRCLVAGIFLGSFVVLLLMQTITAAILKTLAYEYVFYHRLYKGLDAPFMNSYLIRSRRR